MTDDGWARARYIRHLPPKGSLGAPKVFQEAEEEHEHGAENQGQHTPDHGAAEHQQPHQH